MVNIAQAWAEQYHREHPNIRVQVLGGGSGVGIASLIDGNCDMANTSRKMKKAEIEAARGIAGRRAAGNRRRPRCLGHLRPQATTRWTRSRWRNWPTSTAKAGKSPAGRSLACPRERSAPTRSRAINRQSSSGTYAYFREAVLGKGKDLKLASIDANGSKDAVSLVSHTPSAIGYSGMGYATPRR